MTIDMDVVQLSRLQFGLIALYHFLFVPLTLGLAVLLGIDVTTLEGRSRLGLVKSGDRLPITFANMCSEASRANNDASPRWRPCLRAPSARTLERPWSSATGGGDPHSSDDP